MPPLHSRRDNARPSEYESVESSHLRDISNPFASARICVLVSGIRVKKFVLLITFIIQLNLHPCSSCLAVQYAILW